MLAIVGGSGHDKLGELKDVRQVTVATPYGDPAGPLEIGMLGHHEVVFLARHGAQHSLPPHQINYRANLWALHAQQVREVVAIATVGGIGSDFPPGTLVVPDQIIDYTWGRAATFFDGGANDVRHVDFTNPYDESLRQRIVCAAAAVGEVVHEGGTYGVTQGPRLETAAEIRRMARDGAHLIGMTGMPEAALARELDMRYATLAVVVNAAAGTGTSVHTIDLAAAQALAHAAMQRVVRILMKVAANGD